MERLTEVLCDYICVCDKNRQRHVEYLRLLLVLASVSISRCKPLPIKFQLSKV